MRMRDAVIVGLAAAALAACDDENGESPAEEPAPGAAVEEPGTPERDTTPPTVEDIDPATPEAGGGEGEETGEETPAPAGEPGTVAAGSLGERVYTVQIGAFVRDANASDLVRRVESEGFPLWSAEADVGGRAFRRVRVGALTSPRRARELADLLANRYGLPTWVVPVPPETPLPAGIAEATRRALRGG